MAQTIGTSESAGLWANTRGKGFACTLSSSLPRSTAPCRGWALPSPPGSTAACSKIAGGDLWSLTEGKGSLIPPPNFCPHSLPLSEPPEHLCDTTLLPSPPKKSTRHGGGKAGDSLVSSPAKGGIPAASFTAFWFCPLSAFCGFMFLSRRGNFWLDLVQSCCLAHTFSCSLNFWFVQLSFDASPRHWHIFLKLD